MTNTAAATSTTRDVSENYSHFDKYLSAGEMLTLPRTTLKWYSLAPEGEPVPAEIKAAARKRLQSDADNGQLEELGDLGFVILHRCGKDFYFLLVNSWKNNNEIWETVYAKDGSDATEFSRFQAGVHHRATFCVWELAAVMHEKDAWRRFLISERCENDRLDYLENTYNGAA